MGDVLEQKEAQLAEVLAASNLDPATLTQLNAVSVLPLHAVTAWECMQTVWPVPACREAVPQAGALHGLVHDSACESALLHPCPGHCWTSWEWQAASCCFGRAAAWQSMQAWSLVV